MFASFQFGAYRTNALGRYLQVIENRQYPVEVGVLYTVALGLIGAFCWGLAPVFGKLGLRNLHPIDGLAIRTLVALAVMLVWIFSSGGIHRLYSVSQGAWILLGIEAFLATLAGDLAYYAALKRGSLSVAAVVLASSPVVTAWADRTIFQQTLSLLQIVGMMCVGIGIVLVAVGYQR